MKIAVVISLFICFLPLYSQDPPDTLWTFNTGNTTHESALLSIQQTEDEGFICAGYIYPDSTDLLDFWLLKLTEDGLLDWQTNLGGDDTDHAVCIRQTADLGFIVAGTTSSYGSGPTDFWLVKTDQQGNIEWEQAYGGFSYEFCQHVEQAIDGGFIATGYTASYGNGDYDIWILKTDEFGEVVWDITYGGADGDYGECVQQTSDGGYVICGFTYSVDIGTSDVVVIKLDSNGSIEWSENYGFDGWDYAYSIQQTSDSGFIISV